MILPAYLRNSSPWLSEFSRLFDNGVRYATTAQRDFRVHQDASGWNLELDFPGVPKDELELQIENRSLLLRDKRVESGKNGYRLPLGSQINTRAIQAELKDGVLKVRLPRIQPDQKTIEIL